MRLYDPPPPRIGAGLRPSSTDEAPSPPEPTPKPFQYRVTVTGTVVEIVDAHFGRRWRTDYRNVVNVRWKEVANNTGFTDVNTGFVSVKLHPPFRSYELANLSQEQVLNIMSAFRIAHVQVECDTFMERGLTRTGEFACGDILDTRLDPDAVHDVELTENPLEMAVVFDNGRLVLQYETPDLVQDALLRAQRMMAKRPVPLPTP